MAGGRGAFRAERRDTVRSPGRRGSDDAGISSEKESENLSGRKFKVSWGRFVRPGLAGPKVRPKGVADGQTVEIPSPVRDAKDTKG